MKKLFLLVCSASLFVSLLSQAPGNIKENDSKNVIGIYSGAGILEMSGHENQTGIVAAHGNSLFTYGLSYDRYISKRVRFETGIFYAKYCVTDHLVLEPYFNEYLTEYLRIISIPVVIKYYFPGNFYINGGTIIDFGLSRGGGWDITDAQNGFALCAGGGKEFSLNKFSIYIEPDFILHAAIPFSGDLTQKKFFVPGVKIGLNYKIN